MLRSVKQLYGKALGPAEGEIGRDDPDCEAHRLLTATTSKPAKERLAALLIL
jgi:hypothetical protein